MSSTNQRVALGITCVQCTPVQLEILRRAGAMPVSSRRCGMITRREAERLCKSFLGDNTPPRLPEDFAFLVHHECAWGCHGAFIPSRYNSSRAKCIKCAVCGLFFSPNKFIFHSHRTGSNDKYIQPDAANFNSWRRHLKLSANPPDEIIHAWEDVKAMFNGGTRKRILSNVNNVSISDSERKRSRFISGSHVPSSTIIQQSISNSINETSILQQQLPGYTSLISPLSSIDYKWHQQPELPFSALKESNASIIPYIPWLTKGNPFLFPANSMNSAENLTKVLNRSSHSSAFHPVIPSFTSKYISTRTNENGFQSISEENDSDNEIDVETVKDNTINYYLDKKANLNVWNYEERESRSLVKHLQCWNPPQETNNTYKFNT
ncbi:SKI family transcriptional corepressor 1 homolog-B [Phymastichus coffea]|uniref:SKI family transcriptional corepressor 1 homolog-B n=1 Tax=Phymastichus coffea TaxID=108790 RepID=UPI00273C2D37|nr:SKI family transcriptional corepressor 1 homolog-B [Phymastichus coffea]